MKEIDRTIVNNIVPPSIVDIDKSEIVVFSDDLVYLFKRMEPFSSVLMQLEFYS